MPDVIAFGEVMVRLAPPHFQRLEQARSLDVEIGGAELNTAAGLVRLGRSAAWVSRLPDNPLGKLVANRVREIGVSRPVRAVRPRRAGAGCTSSNSARRRGRVRSSTTARTRPSRRSRRGMFDWPAIFAGAKWFHVTRHHRGAQPGAAEVVDEAMHAAKAAGVKISVDLNYRAKLWSARARRAR